MILHIYRQNDTFFQHFSKKKINKIISKKDELCFFIKNFGIFQNERTNSTKNAANGSAEFGGVLTIAKNDRCTVYDFQILLYKC